MILSSEEFEILAYLKSSNGRFVPVLEICRRAGGRQRYEESPHWANPLMSHLVEAELIEVNERGQYRVVDRETPAPTEPGSVPATAASPQTSSAPIVDENYFPSASPEPSAQPATGPAPAPTPSPAAAENDLLVDENYFAPPETDSDQRWVSPQIARILNHTPREPGSDPQE